MKNERRFSGKNVKTTESVSQLIRFCRYFLIVISLLFIVSKSLNAQCGYNNTFEATWTAPVVIGDSVYTSCIYGGKYIRVTGMVAGETYRISNCGNENFDSQITIYPAGGGPYIAYSEDVCGYQASIDFTPDMSGDFDILVNEYPCISNSTCMYLVVKKMPCPDLTAYLDIYPYTVCPNTGIYMNANGTATSYNWDFGDGSPFSNTQDNYHTYTAVGSYTVSVYMTNSCGNDTSLSQTIEVVDNIPVTDVNSYVSPNNVCPNTNVYFEAWGYDSDLTYLWDFGDGSPFSTDSYSYHAYATLGSKTASVTITNSCGSDTTLYQTVEVVNNIPVTNVFSNISPNPVCPNSEVYFQAWGWDEEQTYLWDFGDSSPFSTDANSNHTYTTTGSKIALVTITNFCGSDTTLSQTVEVVNNIPVTDVYSQVSQLNVCPNTWVNFQAWGYGSDLTYLWDFGDGSLTSTNSYSSHEYAAIGIYPVTVKITNSCGKDTTLSHTVTVENYLYPVTNVYFEISPNPVCPGAEVSFNAWGYGSDYTYLWNFGDGSPTSTSSYNYHTYATVGNYPASVIITNSCGNDTTLEQTVIVGNTIPVTNVGFEVYPNTVCPNSNVHFQPWGDGISYLWNFGDGSPASTGYYADHSYAAAGPYQASLTITNSCGNDTIVYRDVFVTNNMPVSYAQINVYPNPVCPNSQVHFEAWGDGVSYLWDFGDGSPFSPVAYSNHSYAAIGSKTASVTITNACGNDTTLYHSIQVSNNLFVTYAESEVYPNPVCPNSEVYFNAWGDGDSYLWDFGDGSPASTNSNTVHTYLIASIYNAQVTITNACGNDTILYQTVFVDNSIPVTNAGFEAYPNPVCPNSNVHFQPSGYGTSYLWNFGDGSPVSTEYYADHSYATAGTYQASVKITNNCGNDTTIFREVVVTNNIPVSYAQINIYPNPVCPNSQVHFEAWGDGVSYLWDFGDGSPFSPVAYSNHSYAAIGSKTASVTITNACGNDTTLYHSIQVSNNLFVTYAESEVYPNPVCPNSEVYFNAWGDGDSYLWDFGDGSPASTNSNTVHTYLIASIYNAQVTITNACGNDTILYQTVFVDNSIPVTNAGFEAYPNPVCPNSNVHFQPSGYGTSYLWNFGDGSPVSTEYYADHSYATAGTYQASLTITNSCGNDTIIYRDIYVTNNLPVMYAQINSNPNPVCPNSEVHFDAWGDGVSYLWNFDDDSITSTEKNPKHTYLTIGSYDVSVKITNGCGNDTILHQIVQVSNNLPVTYAEFDIYPNPVCPNSEVRFDAWGDADSYLWDFGDSTLTSMSRYTYHTYALPGSYEASVKLTNSCGNDTILNQTVWVDNNIPINHAEMYINPNPVCPNTEVYIDVYGDGGVSYLYNFGDGSPASSSNRHLYTLTGIYTVSVKITNACGNDTTLYQTVMVADNLPVTNIDVHISQEYACPNTNIYFEADGEGISYVWDFGDGSPTSTLKYPNHVYTSVGVYPISLTITNACGNDTTVYRTVHVESNLPVTNTYFDVYPNTVCPNSKVNFEAYGNESNSSYAWNFGDGSPDVTTSRPEINHFYSVAGTYQAWVKITNYCGNETTLYKSVYVQNDLPVSFEEIDIYPNPVCPNDIVTFEAEGNANSYLWNFGDGSPTSDKNYVRHAFATPGSKNVTLKMTNGCGNEATVNRTVIVDDNIFPNPSADEYEYDVLPKLACAGDSILFYTYSGLGTYLWDFGDGTSTTETTPLDVENGYIIDIAKHSYSTTGIYPTSLTLTNGCGNSFTDQFNITIANNAPVEGEFFWDNEYPAAGENIKFLAYGGSTYLWDFGDGTSPLTTYSTLLPVYHSYALSGNYMIIVSITNSCGNSFVSSDWITIGTGSPCNVQFASLPDVCVNASDFTLTGGLPSGGTYSGTGVNAGIFSPATAGSGIHTIMYTFTDSTGCTNSATQNILVKALPVVSFASLPAVCLNTANFNLAGGLPLGGTYSGTGVTAGSFNPATAGTGTHTLTYTYSDGIGCMNSATQNIVVNSLPVVSLAALANTCQNASGLTLSAGFPAGGTYSGTGVTDGIFNPSVAGAGTHAITYSYTDGNGCMNTASGNIIVNPLPVVSLADLSGVCANAEAFSLSGGLPAGGTFSGTGVTAGIFSPSVAGSGTHAIVYSYSDGNGCTNSATKNIIVNALPVANFNFTGDNTILFSDLSQGNPTAWTWNFGDGTTTTEQNPQHTFVSGGAYTVSLTVINQVTNCISTVTKQVNAGTVACQANFESTINNSTGLAAFTSGSLNATDYYWNFGDGDFSTALNPAHTYKKAGAYTVCLSIWNNSTGCQSVICKEIIYAPVNIVYIVADFSFFTDPGSYKVNFSDLSSSNTTNWYWTMGDGKIMTTKNPVYTYSKPGLYNVCLTAIDKDNFLLQSVCKQVRVGEIVCTIGSAFSYFINPVARDVAFYSKATGSVTDYFWTFGDGGSSTVENPSHNYSTPGYYQVTLAVRNSTNKCMDVFGEIIQVGSIDCRAGFSYVINPLNNAVNFSDNSKGQIDYYYWDFGNGAYSVLQNPENLYKSAGMYNVGQTVIDNVNGCIDYIMQPVQVGEINCAAEFVSYVDSESSTAYFENRVLGEATALLWSFGDGKFSTNENPVHVFPGGGIYSVGLNTYDFNSGCMDFYQEKLLIGGLGIDCEADFVYRADPANPEVVFSNKSIGDIVGSLWNFGDGSDNSIETDPVHSFTKGGYFYVCLNVTNSAGTRNMTCKWVLVEGSAANNCRANFMFSIDSLARKVTFVDKSFGDIDKYNWDFGDSRADSVSTLKDPIHIYDAKGYFLVQLKVENTTSGCVSNEYKLLNVAELQVLKAAFGYEAQDPDKKVAGYPVDLVSASSGDGATVEWDFGDKQIKKASFTVMDSTSGIVTHYYQKSGRYLVCLRISDPVSGQSDEYCNYVFTKNAVGVMEIPESGINLSVYPNPFVDYTTINYSLPDNQFIELAIFDQLGRRIETLVKSRKDPGKYQIIWETKNQATGVYHLKLISPGETITKQLVITK